MQAIPMSSEDQASALAALTFQQDAHYNGGKTFFAYGYTCVQHPPITLFRRYDKKTRQVTDHWRLYGFEVASLQVAYAAMASTDRV